MHIHITTTAGLLNEQVASNIETIKFFIFKIKAFSGKLQVVHSKVV